MSLLETFFTLVQRGPLGMWAFLAGMVISWGVMLQIRALPVGLLSAQARQFVGHFLGFLAAVLATWCTWPTRYGAIVGVAVGLFGPWSWECALLVLEWKWPSLAARLRTPA